MDAVRQVLHRGQRTDGRHRGAELNPIQICFKRDAPALVVAPHLGRSLAEGEIGDGFQGHGLSRCRRYGQVLERRHVIARMFDEAYANGYLAVRE